MQSVRINPIVSDLFFNHQHENYDGLDFEQATREEIERAIQKDANEFVEAYGRIGAIGEYSAQDFANDFLARL